MSSEEVSNSTNEEKLSSESFNIGAGKSKEDDTKILAVEGIDEASINKLSSGFLKLHADDLKLISEPLDELRRNQEILLDTISQENGRFLEAKESLQLDEMFNKVVHYHTKLINIKKEMVTLHEKMAKLKKRAIKLQQSKQRQSGSYVET